MSTIFKKEWIFGTGPQNARIMLVGEAPGKHEDLLKKPFVGPSGELLTEILEGAGTSRAQIYITNVVKIRPPNNDLKRLGEFFNPETGEGYKIDDFIPLLYEEIKAIDPVVIIAMGSLACRTLTGKDGIRSWRGSILPCIGYDTKVIPTIHVAALFDRAYGEASGQGMWSWKQKVHIEFDICRAVDESKFRGFQSITKRSIEIIKNSNQLDQFFRMYKDYKKVYVDTEVYKAHLVCIGFAFTRYHACSVPLAYIQSNEHYDYPPLHDLVEMWKIVAEKLADSELEKAGQNFKSDKVYWLEKAGFEVNNYRDDGMFKIHTISPELPKALAFQQSIFTTEPFHKQEGREYNPFKDKLDVLLSYNAKDCYVNCECCEEMDKEIDKLGLRDFYETFVLDLYPIYESIEKKGWAIDKKKREELIKNYDRMLKALKSREKILLKQLNIEGEYNHNSPSKVKELIYIKMRCPLRKDTRDETLTALMNNAVKDPRKKEVIRLKLDQRTISKIKSTYLKARIDPDDRVRWSINQVGTETGRTSTSTIDKPLRNGTWGIPIQVVPRPGEIIKWVSRRIQKNYNVRSMFIADPGKILIEFDQSQAEARLVALLARDYRLLKLFDMTDVHKLTASFVYNYTSRDSEDLFNSALAGEQFDFFSNITDEERQVGKSSRHGLAYNLGEEGLSIKMKISLYRAKMAFQKVHAMSPNIVGVFHEEIQQALAEHNRVLSTPFGRIREFFNQWGNKLFREAYAHIPQSTIGDNTKRIMRYLWMLKIDWLEFLAETHDAFVAQIPENKVEEFYWIVKPNFEAPIDFERCTLKREPLVIPVDCKIGYNWGEMEKFKLKAV